MLEPALVLIVIAIIGFAVGAIAADDGSDW